MFFTLYGSWEARGSSKILARGVRTFSTIELVILRTFIFRLSGGDNFIQFLMWHCENCGLRAKNTCRLVSRTGDGQNPPMRKQKKRLEDHRWISTSEPKHELQRPVPASAIGPGNRWAAGREKLPGHLGAVQQLAAWNCGDL